MHRTWAIAVVIVSSVNALSQQLTDKPEQPVCGYSELYRKEGWLVPGLDGAKKKTARAAVPGKPGMYLTILEPTKRPSRIQVFQCSQAHVGRLEIADIVVGIGDVYVFDVGGRIFAYGVVYGSDGIAADWHVMFYDIDGSGRFTVRRSERSRFVPDSTPDWIKDDATVQP